MQKSEADNSTHDFQDGNGPVPAHRHINGGGWVAETAHVEDTAYIGPNASVFGHATVKDEAMIAEEAEVSAYATIKDLACIKGKAVIRGACTIMGHAEISGNVFIAKRMHVKDYTLFDKDQCFFDEQNCLECPALLNENYGGGQSDQCICCLNKLKEHKKAVSDSHRSTVRSWFPKDGSINENIETETPAPQKRRGDNP